MKRELERFVTVFAGISSLPWGKKATMPILPASLGLMTFLTVSYFSSSQIQFFVASLLLMSVVVCSQVWITTALKAAYLKEISNGAICPDKDAIVKTSISAMIVYLSLLLGFLVLAFFVGPVLLTVIRILVSDQQLAYVGAFGLVLGICGWILYHSIYVIDAGLSSHSNNTTIFSILAISSEQLKQAPFSGKTFSYLGVLVILINMIFPMVFGTTPVSSTVQIVLFSLIFQIYQFILSYDYYTAAKAQ